MTRLSQEPLSNGADDSCPVMGVDRVDYDHVDEQGRALRVPPTPHPGGHMLRPGDKAPDFVGRDHNGKTVRLSDFTGKPVVLWFFPKADTPG